MSQIEITGSTVLDYWDGPDYFLTTSGIGPFFVNGITAGGGDGLHITIYNNGSDPITIRHNHIPTTEGDRIYLASGLDFILLDAGHFLELRRNWGGPSGAGWYDHA